MCACVCVCAFTPFESRNNDNEIELEPQRVAVFPTLYCFYALFQLVHEFSVKIDDSEGKFKATEQFLTSLNRETHEIKFSQNF